MTTLDLIGKTLGGGAVAALLSVSPFTAAIDANAGLHLDPGYAMAKGSNSGRGGGGGGDDDDDRSGRGGGGDDDRSGRGGGDDDDDEDRSSSDDSAFRGSRSSGGAIRVTKIETSGNSVEIRYSDGTKEEIENGRYERKNASNRTIEERLATGADLSRLRSMANGVTIESVSRGAGTGTTPTKVERRGGNIEITYSNGWKEEIEAGRYELKDAFNRTVVERPSTAEDRRRLSSVAGG